MKLYELAFACRLFRGWTDVAYRTVRQSLGDNADLSSESQYDSLLRFLNDWRCRIPEDNFPELKNRLQVWASLWIPLLPSGSKDIHSLTDEERRLIGCAYKDLLSKGAGLNLQATAASKMLHVLRPNSLPAWDGKIKEWFHRQRTDQNSNGIYPEFVLRVATEISELQKDVDRLGIALSDVPALLGNPGISLVKLVDEFYWITITGGHTVPSISELDQWLQWAN